MPRMRRILPRLALRVPLLVMLLAWQTAPLDAQAKRRFLSRAAFADLDSTRLADSSSIQAMDVNTEQDSVLLDMLAFLDADVGKGFGLRDTRMRRWDGFGSQAHPDIGILVDGQELAYLIGVVTSLKGAAGVPKEQATRRVPHILRFLVAHEYAHLLQYRVFGRQFMDSPDSTRVIECGADLIGGLTYYRFMYYNFGGQPYPAEALNTARDFGYVIGSPDWLDGRAHPLPENRRLCIATGMGVAGALNGLAAVRQGATDSGSLRSAKFLETEEPGLYNGTLTLMGWSRLRGRQLGAAGGAVVDGSRELAVVRDSSVSRLVRVLAEAAVRGDTALRRFRAGRPPGDDMGYLLRQSLPPPWQCFADERLKAEEAACLENIRAGPGARQEAFESLIRGIEQGLAGTPWRRAVLDPDDPALPRRLDEEHQLAVFVHGGEPYDLENPQVEVSLSLSEMFPTAQLPPRYQLALTVRSAVRK